jgi:hypothetical protein
MKEKFTADDLTKKQAIDLLGEYEAPAICPNCSTESFMHIPKGTSVYEMNYLCPVCEVGKLVPNNTLFVYVLKQAAMY